MFDAIFMKISSKINNLHRSVYPLYVCLKLIGLSNYKLVKTTRLYAVDKMAIARCVVQFLAYYYIALTTYISMIVEDTPDDVLSWVAVIYNTATCTMLIVSSILSTLFTGRIISIMNQIEKIDLEFKQMGLALNHWYDYYIYRGDD